MKTNRIFTTIRLLVMSVLAGSLMMSGCGPGQLLGPTITPTVTSTATITPTPTVGPGSFPRIFHVEGNAFVDQFGQPMMFRGIAMPEIRVATKPASWQIDWNENLFEEMASWGSNIVRVQISPLDIHSMDWPTLFNVLDQTIAWAGENRMYVVIDFHSVGSITENWYNGDENNIFFATNMQEFLDFWDRISERYASNDIVAFYELFNEPASSSGLPTSAMWMAWKGAAEQAISVIRANDPDKIILVAGVFYAYDLSYTADAPITGENIGYVTHPYPQQMWYGRSWDAAFGNLSEKYPVFATEFTYDDNDPMIKSIMIGNIPYNQAIIDYLEEHQISWMVFQFDCGFLISNKNFTPTPQGTYFRSRLLYELEGSPKPRPGNFTKTTPADRASDTMSNPVLTWIDSVHSAGYEYCIDTSSNDACDTSWISTGTGTSAELSGLAIGTPYSWQVRAANADGITYADDGTWGAFTVSSESNLAMHQPVTASSYEKSGLMAEFAEDGDYTTRWSSEWSDPQWIQVDLGAVFDISRIVLYWETSFSTAYEIQVSDNGVDWTTIYSTTTGAGGTERLNVSGSGRYVRLYGTQRVDLGGNRYGYSLWEFEVYGSQP